MRCPICKGKGYIYNPQLSGESKVEVCQCVEEKCLCNKKPPYIYIDEVGTPKICYCNPYRKKVRKINISFKNSMLPRRYRWKFKEDFKTTPYTPEDHLSNKILRKAYEEAKNIWENYPNISKGLYLYGPPGTGKTLLASIVLNELIFNFGITGRFLKLSREFFNKLRYSFHEESEIHGQAFIIEKEISAVDILIIDDFGVQKNTPWEHETMYNLIDTRYETEKLTIITSNHPPEDFKDLYEGRIYSRIIEMTKIVSFEDVIDFRKKHENRIT